MNQPTNVHQRIQRFFEKKAIAIPLRTIRFIFMLYLVISAVAFTIIIIYPGDFLKDSLQPNHIPPTTWYPTKLRDHAPPNPLLSPDSLKKFSKHLK